MPRRNWASVHSIRPVALRAITAMTIDRPATREIVVQRPLGG